MKKTILYILFISLLYSEEIDYSKTIILKGGNNARICSPSYLNSPISDSNITITCKFYKQKIIDISNNTKKEFERMINDNIDDTSSKFKDIKNTIQQIGNTIKVLETYQIKLPLVEKNLYYIENQIFKLRNEHQKDIQRLEAKNQEQDDVLTKLQNYILNFNKIYTGMDILYPNQLDYGLNIEVENYDTTTQSSNFLKLSTFKLTELTNYTTLGNNIEKIDNDKKLYSIDLGYRKFFNSHRFINKSDTYLGASIGGTYIDDSQKKYSSFSASLLVGLKYNNMFIGELGYKYIDDISSKNIHFDGLGNNNSFYSSKNEFIPFISIKFLLWR